MSNGDELNEQLEFEERIKSMPPDERTIFIAKQTYALTNKFDSLDKKLDNYAGMGVSRKTSAATGGITAAVLLGIVEGLKAIFGRG